MTTSARTLDAATLAEFRARLLEARSRLLRVVATTDDELATLEAHQAGALTEDVPRAQAQATLSRLEGREKHELEAIHAAWSRLEAGTFGRCEACDTPLPLARLRALPTARYCVACQAQREPEPR